MSSLIYKLTITFILLLLSACKEEKQSSLADIDISTNIESKNKVFIKPKTDEEIRTAYTNYLNNAGADDSSRLAVLTRLAELEFSYSDRLLQQQESLSPEEKEAFDDKLYGTRLDKTITLLSTSLKDYPKSKNNDTLLYQIAKAYDQRGDHQESVDALSRLIDEYPKSPFYAEAQFRVAEDAFLYQDYSTAEFSYTEVIIAKNNDIFYEKSLFKRGWARFKQQYYTDAVDDFLEAVLEHDFDEFEKLNVSERDQFDEYFRAVGLAFSYLGGSEPLYDYFKNQPDFIYTYHTYSMVADIYLKQERYSDAVDTHQQFINHYPKSDNIPYSHLKIIEIWKNSGFTRKIYSAIEDFYVRYNPSSAYWKNQNKNSRVNRAIRRSLKEYVVLMAGYNHNKYQKTTKSKDYEVTSRWYQRYLKHYSAYAQKDNIYFLYAELLSQKHHYKEALKWYKKSAEQGFIHAQFDLASKYYHGEGVLKDDKSAFKWFRKSAEQGDADAQFNLGLIYANGNGVTRDHAEAANWYRKAADQGFAKAQTSLGVMYAEGQGVSTDFSTAVLWFRKAAYQGNSLAQHNLGLMYGRGQGVPQDFTEAYAWESLAAISGHEDAIKNRDNIASNFSPEELNTAQRTTKRLFLKIKHNKAKQ